MFWDLSPRELAREFEAAKLRNEDAYDLAVIGAWMTVYIKNALHAKKRMPQLAEFLSREKNRQQQSYGQMRAQLETLAHMTGFPVKRIKKESVH